VAPADTVEPVRHLRVQSVQVPVRNLDASLAFFRDGLGFRVVAKFTVPPGRPVAIVAPPDGTSNLMVTEALPGESDDRPVGRPTGAIFVTNDILAQHREWVARGVTFPRPPVRQPFGATGAVFEDPDGNTYHLVEADAITEQLEAERRALAERAERDRRVTHELAIARDVQSRLFPQTGSHLGALDCAGSCEPARVVGGDYYDVIPIGPHRLAIAVGDVAGKGIAAALLMASLQANVRGQAALDGEDLAGRLAAINRSFLASSPDASYATLFFAVFDDRNGRLAYANCGHLPGLVVRSDGRVERLSSTAQIVGMFETFACRADETILNPGDVLVLYTDGVTEATDDRDEDFGEARLVETLVRLSGAPAIDIVRAILGAVAAWSGDRREDDVTVLVARRAQP